jgi:NADH-quinone oxidoreductase subunit G
MYRFRPRQNAAVNQYWLCDEGRFSFARYQSEHRVLAAFLRQDGRLAPAALPPVLAEVSRRLAEIRSSRGDAAVAGVISAKSTNEEAYLFARLVSGSLGGAVYGLSWSPPEATGDAFLRRRDKNPNTRGLAALGLSLDGLDALGRRVESGQVKALFVFRADLKPIFGDARLQALADELEYLVVADSDGHATAGLADAVLPLASFAETDGTFTNANGRVQRLRQAFAPPGSALPGWKLLCDLGRQMHGDAALPSSAEAVFAELAAVHEPFAGLSYGEVGLLGAPLNDL